MDTGVAVALITGISGIVIAIVTGIFSLCLNQRVTTLQERVKDLERENTTQNKRLDRIRKILREWWEGIQSLLHQIGEAELIPVWKPDKPHEIDEELA